MVTETPPSTVAPFVPPLPYRSIAQRIEKYRLPYRIADRIERRAFARRSPFPVGPGSALSLRRHTGRLRVVEQRPDLTDEAARRRNEDLVFELCDAHEIPYFAVPEPDARRLRVGVAIEHWRALVDALIGAGRTHPVYLGVAASTRRGGRRRWSELSTNDRIARAAHEQAQIEVFRIMSDGRDRQLFGREAACVLERWDRDPGGTLIAPTRNGRSTRLGRAYQEPATIERGDREIRTLDVFTTPTVFDLDFPVDVVYMWVDGSDPAWLQRKIAALERRGEVVDIAATTPDRFRDSGELRWSLRSLERYAPWVRRVFLVSDQQIPPWLATTHPSLEVVDHAELFGTAGQLPTYNSHAIGARLHHIEGLSEHYLCVNDDIFVGREIGPGAFFQSNGVSKFFLSRSTLPFSEPGTVPEHESARRNVVNLLQRDFGRIPTRAFFHTPIPQRRSVLFEIEERYRALVEQTWSSQFRSASDYEINCWLHHYYGYLTGTAVPASIRYDYFDMSDEGAWRRMQRLDRRRDMDVFCVNDNAHATPGQRARAVDWLEHFLPNPSSFEL